jgi:superfamily II DNA or RNA helicase
MAFQLAGYMREQGVSALAVNGESDISEQRRAIRDFEAGQLQVICNVDIFTEGLDIPSINCVVFARPTKSQIVYAQTIGRGTRPSPATGKTDCLVLDLVGAANKFDLCTLASLFGINELKDGEDVRKAIEREKQEQTARIEREQERLRVQGELRAQEIDLFGGGIQKPLPELKVKEKKPLFEWIIYRERKQSFLISGGHEFMISKVGDTYTFTNLNWTSKFEGQTSSYLEAKAKCEAEMRRVLFGGALATEKQIALMTKHKIKFQPDVTKAEASTLLQPLFDRWDRNRNAREAAKNEKEVVTI